MGISLSTTYVPNWQTACAATFNCTSKGLVNISGAAIFPTCPADGSIPAEVWGITARACNEQCGSAVLSQSVEFSSSAITIATWLLPWLGLIAQLPFEANGWLDLLSACLCVGSPVLAAYSLALTALNRRYIARKFQRLKNSAEKDTRMEYHYMVDRVGSAAFILQEAQQCPMRVNQRTGELGSLIALNDKPRQNFWRTAAKDLSNTRRGFTYSFLAQVLLAFLTYLISFIAAVHDSLGSPDVGLQFASSTVWSWMFPIVFGYIRVGSQCKAGAIKEALLDNMIVERDPAGEAEPVCQKGLIPSADLTNPWESPEPLQSAAPLWANQRDTRDTAIPGPAGATPNWDLPDSGFSGSGSMGGFKNVASTSRLEPSLNTDQEESTHETHPLVALPATWAVERAAPPMWCGFDVRGDERREGPIFNYARIFTWFAFAEHVGGGFETAIETFKAKADIPVTSQDAADCCGFAPRQHLAAFAAWSDLPTAFRHMFGAACVALFLQWGTTGAAIFVAYSTPAVGLGCRSASYLIYGTAATLSWALLVFSNLISHALMRRLEKKITRRQSTGILGALAVITRVAGQALAIANAGWLIASSVMEDIGTFQNCWCQTDALQYGANGWTPVFKVAADLSAAASGIWIGFVFSMVVSLLIGVFFAYE
ncbi:hypothetical protein B0H19DRAFT_1202764 [Mycena capillaripes]|nr:hypothetical protein B0H19DRAFT_1202764 [Mycena capillaripes]